MSVVWNAETTEAHKNAAEATDEVWKAYSITRDTLVICFLATGFPKGEWAVTEENVEEMFIRVSMQEIVYGVFRFTPDRQVEIPFTLDELKQFIGLRVNAGNKTKHEFGKDILRGLRRKAMEGVPRKAI